MNRNEILNSNCIDDIMEIISISNKPLNTKFFIKRFEGKYPKRLISRTVRLMLSDKPAPIKYNIEHDILPYIK